MERLIPGFMTYLMQVKNASKSTMSSYERDLKRLAAFLDAKGVHTPEDVTATSLNSYILFLEREGFSTATVSRNVASMKSFFHYVCDSNRRLNDPTSQIRAPHIDPEGSGDPFCGGGGKPSGAAGPGDSERNPRQGHAGASLCHGNAGDGAHSP